MFTHPVAAALRTTAAAVLLGAAAVTTAGIAHAERPMTATDQEFLQSLDSAGIAFAHPTAAIDFAGSVCDMVANGYFFEELAGAVATSETDLSALTAEQTEVLLFDSVYYYCSDLLPNLA